MRNVTGFIVGALTAVLAATANAGTPADEQLTEARIQGVWDVAARICNTSGNPARDGFVLGRDQISIRVSGTSAELVTTSNGVVVDQWMGEFNIDHNYLVMRQKFRTATERRILKVPFDITQYPTLIITTSGFGEGGSCAPGENLNSYFRLKGVTK